MAYNDPLPYVPSQIPQIPGSGAWRAALNYALRVIQGCLVPLNSMNAANLSTPTIYTGNKVLPNVSRRVSVDSPTSGKVLTLPDAATFGAILQGEGSTLWIYNVGMTDYTVQCAGSDVFSGSGAATSLPLMSGDTFNLVPLQRSPANSSGWIWQSL